MAFNAMSSAFVAILCLALTLCVNAENATRAVNDDCNCVCGVSRSSRIVGGVRTEKGEFPWLVALYNRGTYYCGGTLITEKHVLTAAHCFDKIRTYDVTMTMGSYNIRDPTEKPVKRTLRKVTKHPDFNMLNGYDSDIAIAELDEPVAFGAWNVGTGCLPDETYVDYKGTRDGGDWGTVVGRGRTKENGQVSPIPLKVDLPLMSMSLCKSAGYRLNEITDNMFCAGYEIGQKDACQGDSGGPMHRHLDDTEESTYEVIGVVSWGRGCARKNLPGVYTRVQKFIPWVREQIKGACECRKL